MSILRAATASCVLLLFQPATAQDATDPYDGSGAYAPSLQSARQLDSLAKLSSRWGTRLVTQLDRDRLSAATSRAPTGEAMLPLPAPLLAKRGTPATTAGDAQWLGAAHVARVVGNDPVGDQANRAASADPTPAGFSQKLGNWAILGIFMKFGVLPLLPAFTALAIGMALLLRWRRRRTLANTSVLVPAAARATTTLDAEQDGVSESADSNTAEAFDFYLESATPAAPTQQTRDAAGIAELRLRASDLGHRVADPDQRRRLALAASYLDLGHLTAARELIEDIERADQDAWKVLFAGQSAAS